MAGIMPFLLYPVLSLVCALLFLPAGAKKPALTKGAALFLPADLEAGFKEFQPQLISPFRQIKKGEEFFAGIRIKIPEGWHSYWSFAGDFGQAPEISWRPLKGARIKPLPFPAPERKAFAVGQKDSHSFIFEKELLIPFKIFVEEAYREDSLPLFLSLRWFVCKEICLSKEAELALDLKIGPRFKPHPEGEKAFGFWSPFFPKRLSAQSHFKTEGEKRIIHFDFKEEIKCLDIFPKSFVDFSSAPPVLLSQGPRACSFQAGRSESNLSQISGRIVYSKRGEKSSALFQSARRERLSLFWFMFMAFLGGLILNVMPCVLPIIFLKFYGALELKRLPRRKILFLNLSYALGVISSFLFLAFFIFVSKRAGESLGWGFHLQSPSFVSALSALFFLMGLWLLGAVSLSFPKVSLGFKDERIFSHFMTGALSATAASPCVVPFMAGAAAWAFSRSYVEIFAVFSFLGLGLSSPYLALSFFPRALKFAPRPGRWAEILKKLFSLPLFLTALWLVYILYLQSDIKAFALSLLAFPLLALWAFFQKRSLKPIIKKTAGLAFMAMLLAVFIGQKRLNRSFQPLADLKQKSALGWRAFDESLLEEDKQKGQAVFAVFGAEWCLTCKLNERIFKSPEFKSLVKEKGLRLYYGDWTNKTPEIAKFLKSYGQPGVPFYIFLKGEEKLFIFPSLLFKGQFLRRLRRLSE